jgi:peptidoglycan/xylan/chitin deacetylase (PgdA/CDA1 family)
MRFRVLALIGLTLTAPDGAAANTCGPEALGVARTVEIDTTGGPGFGLEQYKAHDFLLQKEVVLTFDDGPQKIHTEAVLNALGKHCTKATFFSIGKMALGYPEILRRVAAEGHTVGTHTWSHANLRGKKDQQAAIDEIERGVSAVKRAMGGPIAPFFRYPYLADSKDTLTHLQARNIAVFSMDADSFDFKFKSAEELARTAVDKIDRKGKGILLMHDIQPVTAKAVPLILTELKARGYKVVHMRAKTDLKSLPEYDKAIEKDVKGLPTTISDRPTSTVVRTVPEAGAAAAGGAANAPAASGSTPADGDGKAAEAESKPSIFKGWFGR